MSNNFYVYSYKNPLDGSIFYIGMGHNLRCYSHLKEARRSEKNNHKLNVIRKILKEGLEPIIEIWQNNLTSTDAKRLEKQYIKLFGRKDLQKGNLLNLTDGGDGNTNWSKELRNKISNSNKDKIMAKDEHGEIVRVDKFDLRWLSGELVGMNKGSVNSNKNGKLDGYIIAKDSNGNSFRVKPDDPRWISGELVGINKNKKAHENTISAAKARKGNKRSKESIEKGRLKQLGKPKSEEHKKKLSEAIKNSPKNQCAKCNRLFSKSNYTRHINLNKCS